MARVTFLNRGFLCTSKWCGWLIIVDIQWSTIGGMSGDLWERLWNCDVSPLRFRMMRDMVQTERRVGEARLLWLWTWCWCVASVLSVRGAQN